MKRVGAVAAVLLLLTGCSGGITYASSSELVTAYVAAGNDCPNPAEVGELLLGEGAHGSLCPDVTMLIVFDGEAAMNRYLAGTLNGTNGLEAVVGERWVIMTDDAERIVGDLGGTVRKE